MILSSLKLENFKKYKSYNIEFKEGLVGIIGKNGSGKSTIFEAILFALYGELKNKGFKEVIRNSDVSTKDAVLVELCFEFDSIEYKVSREFRGKALSANAKFYKTNELITTGAKEVTSSIVALTNMNKESFLHTLFASQKELSSLSAQKPEDRKKMIRKLLGLQKIDFVEKELIEKSRELNREIKAFDEVLLSKEEEELKQKHIGELTISSKEIQISSIEEIKVLNSLKLDIETMLKELKVFKETKDKKLDYASKCELLKNTISAHLVNKNRLEIEINTLNTKQKELEGLQSIKNEYKSLYDALKELEILKEYHLRKEGLILEQDSLREQYTKSKNSVNLLQEQTKEYTELIKKINILEIDIKSKKEHILKKQNDENLLLQSIAAEERLVFDTSTKISKIKELGKDSNCPTCTRPLLEEYDTVLLSLHSIVKQTQNEKIEKAKTNLEIILLDKRQEELNLKQSSSEHFELSKSINLIENRKKDLIKEEEHFEKIKKHGLKNKEELEKLQAYTYDSTKHEEVIKKEQELKRKYEYILTLETMLLRLDKIKEEESLVKQTITSLSIKYDDLELEYNQIQYDELKHKEKEEELTKAQKRKEELVNKINDLKVQMATIQGQIKTISESLENNNTQVKKVKAKKDDLLDYEKIKISLGEFKTKLNQKISPLISKTASSMYCLITKGKYQHIEVSNDFDFYIYDEGKKYPIERFSGGEIDLANLVLRIAISKTLSQLNGTSSIGFLAFDEVFGSQDENRRMEILEAFHTIKEQYRQIFLISHELEIKEMFESIIEL